MTDSMYQTWKRAKMAKDAQILEAVNEIANRHNHTVEAGFGFYIKRNRKNYEEKYAETAFSGWEFTVSTVSSHWDVSEATIFMKQLQQATECAAELNIYLKSLDYQMKKEFKKEMAERQAANQIEVK